MDSPSSVEDNEEYGTLLVIFLRITEKNIFLTFSLPDSAWEGVVSSEIIDSVAHPLVSVDCCYTIRHSKAVRV